MYLHSVFNVRPFALFAAALLAGTAGCADMDRGAAETTVEEVRDEPSAYMGKVITVVGEVEEKYASGAFTIDGKGTWWNDEILVVVPREQTVALDHGTDVRVTGEVMQLMITDIERDYGLDFESELETEYRDKPILMARNMVVIDAD